MSKYLKAIGAAASGLMGWATFVVYSPPAAITSAEWLLLGGVGLTVLAVFGVPNIGYTTPLVPSPPPTNEPAPAPAAV